MRAIVLGDDSPRARTTDPIESHEAAEATVGTVAASQAIVLRILNDTTRPLTDEEIRIEAAWYGRWSESRLRTARAELVEQGRVKSAGKVLPEGHRAHCQTWELES